MREIEWLFFCRVAKIRHKDLRKCTKRAAYASLGAAGSALEVFCPPRTGRPSISLARWYHTTVSRPSSDPLLRFCRSYPAGCFGTNDDRNRWLSLSDFCWTESVALQGRRLLSGVADNNLVVDNAVLYQVAGYGKAKIRRASWLMPSRVVSVPGSPNCSDRARCWNKVGGGRYEPVGRLMGVPARRGRGALSKSSAEL